MNVATVASTQFRRQLCSSHTDRKYLNWELMYYVTFVPRFNKKSVTTVDLLNAANYTAVAKISISAYLYSLK